MAAEEVLRQTNGVRQALNRRGQIAGVVQVTNASEAHTSISVRLARLIPLLDDFHTLALLLMEAQVSGLTLTATVVDFVALAIECEFVELVTVTALCV